MRLNSDALLTFSDIIWGFAVVFEGRVPMYVAKVEALSGMVTAQVLVKLPSSVVTVIVAVPSLMPVTTPFATVATDSLLLFHITFWLVAVPGSTEAVNFPVVPAVRDSVVGVKLTPVPSTAVLTVTVQDSVLLPSSVVTVIVAVPRLTPVTSPLNDTVAMESLLLLHVTDLFALAGETVATKVSLPPTVM
jgi:hypothetical protein